MLHLYASSPAPPPPPARTLAQAPMIAKHVYTNARSVATRFAVSTRDRKSEREWEGGREKGKFDFSKSYAFAITLALLFAVLHTLELHSFRALHRLVAHSIVASTAYCSVGKAFVPLRTTIVYRSSR